MLNNQIVKLLLSKDNYNKYRKYITFDLKELDNILLNIDLLHAKHEQEVFTVQDLEAHFRASNPAISDKKYEAYAAIFAATEKVDVAPQIGQELLNSFRRRKLMANLAQAAWEASEGVKEPGQVLSLAKELEDFKGQDEPEEEVEFVTDDLGELKHATFEKPGLRWRLRVLNEALGSLRDGDFGYIFARPETGKTTLLASEVSFMAQQAVRPVFWFNNEEQGNKVKIRNFQAALGVTLIELFANIELNMQQYMDLTHGNIKIPNVAVITKEFVERMCEKYKPSLIIFDQLDKVQGFKADREDLLQGEIYIWARELAKTYGPVIGVCQADGTAEGQKWLTMAHVANAKTAKQAEADWILGVGKSFDPNDEFMRYLNIPKNKLMGDEDSNPDLRHGRLQAYIRPAIARYEDVL